MDSDLMPNTEIHLEPRVARLETNMETLTRTVSELAISLRETSTTTNQKIDSLVIAVTQAQAPKKTDWSLFISIGFFILALGSAVFWPLNKGVQDNKSEIERVHTSMVEHMRMDNHPVGQARIEALVKDIDLTRVELVKRDSDLDLKIQKETQLMTDLISAKLVAMDQRLQVEMGLKNDVILANQKMGEAALKSHEKEDEVRRLLAESELRVVKEKNDLYIDKLFGRVQELEKERTKMADNEHAELMQWRQKAMGLATSDLVVPLVRRDNLQPAVSPELKK